MKYIYIENRKLIRKNVIGLKPRLFLAIIFLTSLGSFTQAQPHAIKEVWLVTGILENNPDASKYTAGRKNIENNIARAYHINKINQIHTLLEWNAALPTIQSQQKRGLAPLIIFYGHANSTPSDVSFHLKGNDLSIRQIGKELNINKGTTAVIWSGEAGRTAIKLLAGDGHIILASAELEDKDNEPVMSDLLAKILADVSFDENKDEKITFYELHKSAREKTKLWYQNEELIQLEGIMLDGTGNGIGLMDPSEEAAKAAKLLYFEKR